MIGITCGLAIYNSTVVDLHFPLALYKKLLNVKPGLEDLKELSPTEGRYKAERRAARGGELLWLPVARGLKVESTAWTSLSVSDHMARLSRCRYTAPLSRHCLGPRGQRRREVMVAQGAK